MPKPDFKQNLALNKSYEQKFLYLADVYICGKNHLI